MTVAYPKYRPSDVPWIDRVPVDWQTVPLFAVLEQSKVKNTGLVESNLLSLSFGRIVRKDIEAVGGLLPESFETYQIVEPDYLVFRFTDLQNDQRSLRSARVVERGIITSAYAAAKPIGIDARFAAYLMRSYDTSKVFYGLGGGVRQSLKFADVARLPVLVPASPEQRAIADYLDRETARIDTLIEEQQRLIEMLRGRRKAVVERAVFCGLDDAPSTGNPEPWLPDTPAHWPVVQLGFLSDTLAGYAFSSDGFSAHEDHVRLLRGVNVKPGAVDWSDVVYWDTQTQPVPVEYSLSAGDLVFGMDRPFVGAGVRVAPVADDDLPALLLQRVMRIRSDAGADSAYLRYAVATDAFLDYLEPLFTGVSVPHVSEWQVRKFKMPCPPLDEQERIAEYLDLQTAKIDELIHESERFIELSRERRAALITAAVTGQIDVREVA